MTIREPIKRMPGFLAGTRVLMQNIERQRDPDAVAAQIGNVIEQHVVVLRRRSRVESQADVARWMHRAVDVRMRERDQGDPAGTAEVRCTRRCNACCYQHVTCSEPEARLALASAKAAGHELDMARLEKQADCGDADAYQRQLSHADRRCVMLNDDGDCAIYADRPIACRTYRVVTDPALCDTEGNPWSVHGTIASLTTPMAEVVVSAAMQSFRHGSLADLLLAELEDDAAKVSDESRSYGPHHSTRGRS